jgi:predicted TPR repeat methyltransferase
MNTPSPAQLMETARRYQFAENRLVDAERIYRQILAAQPNHAEATHFLGVLAQQAGRADFAEQLIRRSIVLMPGVAGFHNNLGEILRSAGRNAEALVEYQKALSLDQNFIEARANVAVLMVTQGRKAEALALLQQLVREHPNHLRGLHLLGGLLLEMGRAEEAKAPLARVLQMQPDHAEAGYLYAAATGSGVPAAAPSGYVAGVFDSYAEHFDEHLTHDLAYRVPELLKAVVDRAQPQGVFDILDLGCGTGLTGAVFKPRAKSLAGVDLSSKMIDRARQRGIYDALEVTELLPALASRRSGCNLVLAGDVFGYIGDLAPVFTAVRDALRPSGLFAFSIEKHDGERENFILRPSRRYAHSPAYIQSLARITGLQIASAQEQALRKEAGREVIGVIFLLRRDVGP